MVREGHAWHDRRYSGNCPNRSAIARAANSTQLTGMPPEGVSEGELRARSRRGYGLLKMSFSLAETIYL
jgi:hypothetical protein